MSTQTNKLIAIAPAVSHNDTGNINNHHTTQQTEQSAQQQQSTTGSNASDAPTSVQIESKTHHVPPPPPPPGPAKSSKKATKPKKRKVMMACVYCRRSHMICDESRPCQRCLKRNIGHLCHDEPVSTRQKKRMAAVNYLKEMSGSEPSSPRSTTPDQAATPTNNNTSSTTPGAGAATTHNHQIQQQVPTVTTINAPSSQSRLTNNPSHSNGFISNELLSQHSSLYLNQQPVFFSEHAGSEFSSLNEFLQMIDDPEFMNTMNKDPILANIDNAMSNSASAANLNIFDMPPNQQAQLQDQQQIAQPQAFQPISENNQTSTTPSAFPSTSRLFSNTPNSPSQAAPQQLQQQPPPHQQMNAPVVTDNARDKFFLTAADPTTEISPEERLKQVINAKLEAGLLKPYNYAEGYARLQRYMDSHMNPSSRQRILKPLSVFRPAFRAIAKTLKDIDLILVEESFERMLLDYDRVFTSMAIPACLWRRTGEIYRGNKEFASLVEVSIDDLKNGKLTIYELMSEESSVNFWEKYGSIAFDKTQKAVLTSCKLKTKDGRKKKNCCFSFTIRRDRYNIPSCIVGNFIPISE